MTQSLGDSLKRNAGYSAEALAQAKETLSAASISAKSLLDSIGQRFTNAILSNPTPAPAVPASVEPSPAPSATEETAASFFSRPTPAPAPKPVPAPTPVQVAPAAVSISVAARFAAFEAQIAQLRSLISKQSDSNSRSTAAAISETRTIINENSFDTTAAHDWTSLQTFTNASTTLFSSLNASTTILCVSGDCRTSWPSGGTSFAYPFLTLSGTAIQATSSVMNFNGGILTNASSTLASTTVSSLLITGSASSSNFFANNILANGSSTFQSLVATNLMATASSTFASTTISNLLMTGSATSSNFYAGSLFVNGSSSFQKLFSTSATATSLYSTNFLAIASSTLASTSVSNLLILTSATATNFFANNILANGSSTFQSLFATNLFSSASSTFASTTISNLLMTGSASSSNFYAGSLLVNGSSTFQRATSSDFYASAALNIGPAMNFIGRATTTITVNDTAWVIATNTAATASPLLSFNNSAGTTTIQFFGATTTGLTGAVGVGIPMGNFVLIGDGKSPAGINILKGGLCVDNDGWCTASTTGRISSVSSFIGNADLAEMYHATEYLEPGDVVSILSGINISKAVLDGKDHMMGVVSTNPGVVLGSGPDREGITGNLPVALAGRVPVKVSAENGAIAPGDYLTLSSTPGVGAKALKAGTVIGQALEGFSGSGVGTVLVFVKNSYYSGLALDKFPGLTNQGASTAEAILAALESGAQTHTTISSDLTADRMLAAVEIVTPKLTAGLISAKEIKSPTIDALSNRITTEVALLKAQLDSQNAALTSLTDRVTALEHASTTSFSLAAVSTAVQDALSSASEWVVSKIKATVVDAVVGIFTKLCIGNTCIDEQQLINILNQSGQSGSSPAPVQEPSEPPTDQTPPTDETQTEVTPPEGDGAESAAPEEETPSEPTPPPAEETPQE